MQVNIDYYLITITHLLSGPNVCMYIETHLFLNIRHENIDYIKIST